MVFSECTKLKVLYLWSLKFKPPAIAALLEVEEIQVSSRGVAKFIQRYLQTGKLLFVLITVSQQTQEPLQGSQGVAGGRSSLLKSRRLSR